MQDLHSFLSSARSEGARLDTGEFTLNGLKAREKLERHQLGDSGLWLVKLVQAAVRAGAPRIDIKFDRRAVQVRYTLNRRIDADNLLRTVLAGSLPKDPLTFHLVAGIRGCFCTSGNQVSWSCGETQVEIGEHATTVETIPDSTDFVFKAERPSRNFSFNGLIKGSLSSMLKQTLQEYEALKRHCWTCPVPILLDGKELPRSYGQTVEYFVPKASLRSVYDSSKNGPRGGLITAAVAQPDGFPELPYPLVCRSEELPRVLKPFHPGETFVQLAGPEETARAVICLLHSPNAVSSVDWVLDGAVVKSEALELPRRPDRVALRIVVGAVQEQLDLSHFNLRNADPNSIVRELSDEVEQLFLRLEEARSEFLYWHTPRLATKLIGAYFIGVTGVLTMVSPLAALGCAGGGAVGSWVGTGLVRGATFRRVSKFREVFRDFVMGLRLNEDEK